MGELSIYEDGTYFSNNPTWDEEDSPWKAEQISRMLRKNGIVPKTVCEVGCGAGGILSRLSEEYGDATVFSGYEVSPQAVELCKRKEKPNLRFYLKDLTKEQVEFDVLLAIDVVEHVEDCFGFLRKIREKGTYKVFHLPLELCVSAVLRGWVLMHNRVNSGHIHHYCKETALATLRDTGYEILDYCYTKGAVELPGKSWKINLLRLPRRIMFALNQDLAVRTLGGFSLLVLAK